MSSSSAPIRVAVLGIGMSALVFHIPFIQAFPEDWTLHTILERKATPEKSEARDWFPGVKVATTLEQVLEDPEVDAVVISTIQETHFDFAKRALKAGKHVLIEKPLVPTFAEAQELVELARSTGLILATYQNRRFDADLLTVKSLIEDGTFGEISEFESHFDRYRTELATSRQWKELPGPGSGAEYDLGSHLLDQALYLFGRPESVSGIIRNQRLIGPVSDSFIITLSYPPTAERKLPLLVTCRAGSLSLVTPQERFIIRGTKASFIKHGLDPQEDQLKALSNFGGPADPNAVKPTQEGFGKEDKALWGRLETKEGVKTIETKPGRYEDWYRNVADAIKSKDASKLIVKPEQAAEVIEIIEAARRSSEEGRVIKV